MTPERIAAELGPELAGTFFELYAAGYIAAHGEIYSHVNPEALLAAAGASYRRTISKTTEAIENE